MVYTSAVLPHAPSRSAQFSAGRQCASAALARLGMAADPTDIPRGTHGEPLWPEGFVGSITHSSAYIAAAVTRSRHALGVGIDSTEMITDERASRVREVVAHARELQRFERAGFDPATAVTIVFSAKESLFKCLFPLVRRYFDFREAEVERVDAYGHISLVVAASVPWRCPGGVLLRSRFTREGEFVHSSVWLERGEIT
jgi:enterobactin synthetase component D